MSNKTGIFGLFYILLHAMPCQSNALKTMAVS